MAYVVPVLLTALSCAAAVVFLEFGQVLSDRKRRENMIHLAHEEGWVGVLRHALGR